MDVVRKKIWWDRIGSMHHNPFRDGVMKDGIMTNSFPIQSRKMHVSMLGHVL